MIIVYVWQRDSVQALVEFSTRNRLPPNLQEQMVAHVQLKFKTESLQHEGTIATLPKAIRSTVAQHLFLKTLDQVYLFKGTSLNFRCQLVLLLTTLLIYVRNRKLNSGSYFISSCVKVSEMKAEFFPPREDIILVNEAPTEFYIIVSGVAVS